MARSQPKDFTEITTASILMAQLINCLLPHCTLADKCFLFKNATQSLNFYLISLFSEISDAAQGVSPILYKTYINTTALSKAQRTQSSMSTAH